MTENHQSNNTLLQIAHSEICADVMHCPDSNRIHAVFRLLSAEAVLNIDRVNQTLKIACEFNGYAVDYAKSIVLSLDGGSLPLNSVLVQHSDARQHS